MSPVDLYIIAAGNGSRLGASIPKALFPIVDEPCLTNTLRRIGMKFTRVFVVTNVAMSAQWTAYFRYLQETHPQLAARTTNLPIKSGLGDGHATLEGILAAQNGHAHTSEDIVIAWGDVFFHEVQIIDELLSMAPNGSGLIPAVFEPKPYVRLTVDETMGCISAEFSKYGESCVEGLHDQSVFRFKLSRLKRSLSHLHSAFWKKDRYICAGGELSLLYSLHHLYNLSSPAYVYETSYSTRCFNTLQEIVSIQSLIHANSDFKLQIAPNHGDETQVN